MTSTLPNRLVLEDGCEVELDEDGHLANFEQWNEQVAEAFAKQDGIELTETHFKVIRYLHSYYEKYGIFPIMRSIVVATGVNILQMYQLFPNGPSKGACKYAGIPRPASCV